VADTILSVHLISPPSLRRKKKGKLNVAEILMNTIYTMEYEIATKKSEVADVLLKPKTEGVGLMDFHRVSELIARGEETARAALPEIKKLVAAIR